MTYEYDMDREQTNHEGIVIGTQELTIHYRVVRYGPDQPLTADVFNVTERRWTTLKGWYDDPTDDCTYDEMCDWVDEHEAALLRHASESRAA